MNKKILFVDDDMLVVKSIKKLLRKTGYTVSTAQSGAGAIEKIKEENFDLIILDIRMPGINGIEVVKRTRLHLLKNGRPLVPEILMTGHGCREYFRQAQELNVAGYIYKPFDIKELLTSIQVNLSSRSSDSIPNRRRSWRVPVCVC